MSVSAAPNHTSLDQMFLQRIEEIISREKWLAGDPMRDIQKHTHTAPDTPAAAPEALHAAAEAPATSLQPPPPRTLTLGRSPTVLILMLVVLILFLVILIVYLVTL